MGSATATWLDFQDLIDQDSEHSEWWARCDLFFYQYPSVSNNVSVQASRFLRFLKRYFPTPDKSNLCFPSPDLARMMKDAPLVGLPVTQQYRRLVLIGHSLGGVIIRQALVDEAIAHENQDSESSGGEIAPVTASCLSAAVRLFAPAIFGFRPTHFGGFCYHFMTEQPRLRRFLRPLLRANPIHEELQFGSYRLQQLRNHTEALSGKYPWMQALRAHLMFGAGEHVVYMDRYDCDPVYRIVEAQDHQSICKPHLRYRDPLEFVNHGLSRSASV